MTLSKIRILALQGVVVVIIGVVWELVGRVSPSAFFLVGSPWAVARELYHLVRHERMAVDFAITGAEAVMGLLIGTALGSLFGLLLWFSEGAAKAAGPFVLTLGTLPIFAFAPLMIVWFGIGMSMKVAMATFSTVFVAFNQAHRGASRVSESFVEVMHGMRASRAQVFRKVIVPGSLDWVLNSMRLNVGFALLGAFIREFVAADRGLGYIILRAGAFYNVPRAHAIGITLLAFLLDGAARKAQQHRYLLVQWLSVPKLVWR